MEKNDQKIGKIIKEWILAAGLTQGDAARYLGIKQGTISMMLSGKAAFPKDKIRMLIDKFNPPQNEIIEVLKLFFWGNASNKIKLSPLTKIGIKYEAERRATEELIEKGKSEILGKQSSHDTVEVIKTQHANEILKLKLDHAEREKELLAELVKLLQEKDELNKKLTKKD